MFHSVRFIVSGGWEQFVALFLLALFSWGNCFAAAKKTSFRQLQGALQRELHAPMVSGYGKIQGQTTPLAVMNLTGKKSSDMGTMIERAARGRFTVFTEETAWGTTFLLLPARSVQCPTCRPLNAGTLERIFEEAYLFSTFEMPEGRPFALLAQAPEPAAAARCDLRYAGGVSSAVLRRRVQICAQASYHFNHTKLHTISGESSESPARLMHEINHSLMQQGFSSILSPHTAWRLDQGPAPFGPLKDKAAAAWARQKDLVQVDISHEASTGMSSINLFAITSER
jgi:hypothetical protein